MSRRPTPVDPPSHLVVKYPEKPLVGQFPVNALIGHLKVTTTANRRKPQMGDVEDGEES